MTEGRIPGLNWEEIAGIKVVEEGEDNQVLVGGRRYFSWNKSDEAGQRIAIVQIYKLGLGTQEEIAKAESRVERE